MRQTCGQNAPLRKSSASTLYSQHPLDAPVKNSVNGGARAFLECDGWDNRSGTPKEDGAFFCSVRGTRGNIEVVSTSPLPPTFCRTPSPRWNRSSEIFLSPFPVLSVSRL